ncbi:MAG: HD domain-containing phosphohydrolase [Bacillota bacterium]
MNEIMIVDVLNENTNFLADIFSKEGYKVHTVNSCESALLSIAKNEPDIILIGTKLPDIDGFEMFSKLKSKDSTSDIPVIFVSSMKSQEEKIRSFELGAIDFFEHPIDNREVIVRIRNHIEHRKVHLEIQNKEVHYRMLFNSMMNGYATHEIIFDEKGTPIDYKYVDVNPAFEAMTGVRRDQWIGRTVREVIPSIEEYWIKVFGKVATTGEPMVYENYVQEMDKYFQTYAFSPKKNHFSVIANDITERKNLEKAMFAEKEQLRVTFESIGDGIITTDSDGKIVSLNRAAEGLTGWSTEDARGEPFEKVFNITNEITGAKAKNPVKQVLDTDEICELENHTILTSSQGISRNISDSAAPIKDVAGKTIGVVMVFADVTEKKAAQKRLLQSREIIEKMQTGVYIYNLGDINDDRTLRLIFANEASTTHLGIKKFETIGKYIDEIFPNLRKNNIPHKFAEVIRTGIPFESEEFEYDDNDIALSCFSFKVFKLEKESVCVLFENITAEKRYFDEVQYLSYNDMLTGLKNRTFLQKELERLYDLGIQPISLIMGDVNGLKLINDVYGHIKGDNLLKSAAKIFKDCCPKGSVIARWGGDEFVVLLPEINESQAEEIVECIKNKCAKVKVENIGLSISLGISTRNTKDGGVAQLLGRGEDAMYTHKLVEGKSVRSKIIDSLEMTLYERSSETMDHALRLVELSEKLGRKINLSSYELDEAALLAKLHDIGKIGIADKILKKSSSLTESEWTEMKKHSEIGYRIAHSTPELAHISELILCHHERWDGTGYPQKLSGEGIPKLARLMAIIDAFDVMTNARTYSKLRSKKEALIEIESCAGTQFDPEMVREFLSIMG